MSKDKYPNIFSPQMEAFVSIILQIFFATRTVLKIGEYPRIFPSFSWGIFAHVTRLDQSRTSESIWWIIMLDMQDNHKLKNVYMAGYQVCVTTVDNPFLHTLIFRGISFTGQIP